MVKRRWRSISKQGNRRGAEYAEGCRDFISATLCVLRASAVTSHQYFNQFFVYSFTNSNGVFLIRVLKYRLKLERLLNPHS